jgi:hypothetical protein
LAVKEKTRVTDASAVDVNIILPAIQWGPLKRTADEKQRHYRQADEAQRNPTATGLWQRR